MKKKILILTMALCICFISACGMFNRGSDTPEPEPTPAPVDPLPAPAHSIADYFPFTENTMYRYTGIGTEDLTQDAFTMFKSGSGVQVFTSNHQYNVTDVYDLEDGKLSVIFSSLTFFYDNLIDTEDIRGMTVLQEPLVLGQTWNYDRSGAAKCEITNLSAKTTVPYGEFDTMEITITHGDTGTIQRDYYALGIGLVQTAYTTDSEELFMNLSEIVRNTTRTVEYDVCLANTTTDRLEFEKRTMRLTTNMDFLAYLNTALKEPLPVDYQPLLPGDSKIQSMSILWKEVLLTVDMSADFITSMDAGAGIELDTLQALANTLGNFFFVNKVEILVDGKNYESGHVQMLYGEYFDVQRPDYSESAQ